MTKKEISTEYSKASVKIAEMISVLSDFKNTFRMMSDEQKDNADPECDADDAIQALGKLLASVVIYADEYNEK